MSILKISAENTFIKKHLEALFKQKKTNLDFLATHIVELIIHEKNNKIIIQLGNNILEYILPLSAKKVIDNTFLGLSNFCINVNQLEYYPFSGMIKLNEKKISLNLIHNSIFAFLVFYPNGYSKDKIYSAIWSGDRNISINKLDTHLTNLKDVMVKNLNFQLEFKSTKGNLTLVRH